ncbi:hypothetical protein [Hymenobacter persicinus]|uniref:DUF3575 domain-containing protein n=1 Tax=Hymenobacter persicinus TaxID=2025506 RepID=A0A4Q5L6T9_9BACT|nr:hypothetical protein [Hymenobacter persicinus]RYU75831.1 hypothetical protein EWM57_19390 [Hymenobacter persicinus]
MSTRRKSIWGGCLGALLLAAPAVAQHADYATDSAQLHRRPVFQLDVRNSILNHRYVTLLGLKLGVEWRTRVRTGLGVYLLSSPIPSRQPLPAELPAATRNELRFRYVAAYGEYVLLRNRRWELSSQLQMGVGKSYSRYFVPDGTVLRSPKRTIWLTEPTVAAQLRIFRWFSLGSGLGWRQPVFVNELLQHELNGPVFYGRAKVSLGDLYKTLRFKRRLFSQNGLRPDE